MDEKSVEPSIKIEDASEEKLNEILAELKKSRRKMKKEKRFLLELKCLFEIIKIYSLLYKRKSKEKPSKVKTQFFEKVFKYKTKLAKVYSKVSGTCDHLKGSDCEQFIGDEKVAETNRKMSEKLFLELIAAFENLKDGKNEHELKVRFHYLIPVYKHYIILLLSYDGDDECEYEKVDITQNIKPESEKRLQLIIRLTEKIYALFLKQNNLDYIFEYCDLIEKKVFACYKSKQYLTAKKDVEYLLGIYKNLFDNKDENEYTVDVMTKLKECRTIVKKIDRGILERNKNKKDKGIPTGTPEENMMNLTKMLTNLGSVSTKFSNQVTDLDKMITTVESKFSNLKKNVEEKKKTGEEKK